VRERLRRKHAKKCRKLDQRFNSGRVAWNSSYRNECMSRYQSVE
jgi:hypothetical protein